MTTAKATARTSVFTHRAKPRAGRAIATIALLPLTAFLIVFAVYPLAELVRLALSKTTVQGGAFVSAPVGLQNFGPVLAQPEVQQSLLVTGLFVVLAVGLTVVLGLALALLVNRAVLLLRVARSVLLWPTVIAPVVVSLMWLLLLSPTVGGLNKVLATVGLPSQGWLDSSVGAFIVVVIVDVWHWTPLVFLFMFTALQAVSPEVHEAARMDGATEWQVLRNVTIPMLTPAIAVVTVLRLVMSVKAFDEMFLLTHGGPNGATNLISLQIRTMFFDQLAFGPASALSMTVVVALLLAIVIASIVRRLISKRKEEGI